MIGSLVRDALRTRWLRVSLGITFALGVGLCFLPLFGTLGIENALALCIVTPVLAAFAGTRLAVATVRRGVAVSAFETALAAMTVAALLLVPPLLCALANGIRVPWCAPERGFALFALLPLPGVLLAAAIGAFLGSAWPRPRVAWLMAIVPLVSIGWTLGRFYATPAIFAFDPFFGWFPGTLYDEVIPLPVELFSYRAFTFAAIAAVLSACAALGGPDGRLRLREAIRHPVRLLICLVFTCIVVAGYAAGPKLGHRISSDDIEEELGLVLRGQRCDVVLPKELDRREARRLLLDCEYRLQLMERRLFVRGPARVRAFFFRNPEEKRRLMGAAETHIAKPWRNEVYLHLSSAPHPVLAHELAHVVAGSFGRGPFRIAGAAGGVWPSPGLIEGVAVAAAWESRDGLTPHEWSRAMVVADMAPSPSAIVGASFLGAPAGRAYTVSGSFVRFLLDGYGARSLHRAYAAGTIEGFYPRGLSPRELEREWRRFLLVEAPPPRDVELARARYAARAIWDEPCAHHLAELREEAVTLLSARDPEGAVRVCREVVDAAPHDAAFRAVAIRALALTGRVGEARRELDQLRTRDDVPRPFVAAAEEALADAEWARGRGDLAAPRYEALLREPRPEAELRLLEVKEIGAREGSSAWPLRDFLLGDTQGGATDPAVGIHLLRRYEETRTDGLAAYMLARQLAARGEAELARVELERALARGLPTPRIVAEAERMLPTLEILAASDVNPIDEAKLARAELRLSAIARDRTRSRAVRDEARDWSERARWLRAHR